MSGSALEWTSLTPSSADETSAWSVAQICHSRSAIPYPHPTAFIFCECRGVHLISPALIIAKGETILPMIPCGCFIAEVAS